MSMEENWKINLKKKETETRRRTKCKKYVLLNRTSRNLVAHPILKLYLSEEMIKNAAIFEMIKLIDDESLAFSNKN